MLEMKERERERNELDWTASYFEGMDGTLKSSFKFESVREPDQNPAAAARLCTGFVRNEIDSIQLALDQFL